MYPYIGLQLECMQRETRNQIVALKQEIVERTRDVERLELLLLDKDRACHPLDNEGRAIDNLDDREELLKFFCDGSGKYDGHLLGLFWHHANVIFECRNRGLECPQWYIDKYGAQ